MILYDIGNMIFNTFIGLYDFFSSSLIDIANSILQLFNDTLNLGFAGALTLIGGWANVENLEQFVTEHSPSFSVPLLSSDLWYANITVFELMLGSGLVVVLSIILVRFFARGLT